MFDQNKNRRYANNNTSAKKKNFYVNNPQCKKFFYQDVGQKKNKLNQKFKANFGKYNKYRNKRSMYYADLLQNNSDFPLEEQVIFERLWKCALGQTFGNRMTAKIKKKSCCCHCQCGNSDELPARNNNVNNGRMGVLKSLIHKGISQKTMKSVVRYLNILVTYFLFEYKLLKMKKLSTKRS